MHSGGLKPAPSKALKSSGCDSAIGGIDIVAVADVAPEMMAARREQGLVQAEALRFRDAPRREPFAAHVIDMHQRLLEDRHRDAGASEHRRQRAAADSSADDHDLGVRVFFHAAQFTTVSKCAVSILSARLNCRKIR